MMRVEMLPPAMRALFEKFSELTGITFRAVGDDQTRQSDEFLKLFTLEELELVIRWTKMMIGQGANGFSPASLQWKIIMGQYGTGNMFQTFQERLGLAQEAVKRRALRVPKPQGAEPAKPEAPAVDSAEEARLRNEAREGFRNFKL